MTAPTDDIPILAADLTLFRDTTNAVLAFLHARDLAEQYRKLDNRNRRSPLTNAVGDMAAKIDTYLTEEEADSE